VRSVTFSRVARTQAGARAFRIMLPMKAELKRQKQSEREREARQRRNGMIAAALLAVIVVGFAAARSAKTSAGPAGPAPAGTFRRISAEELKVLVDQQRVTIIDVRSSDQFLAAHIPGSLQIPLARIDGETPYLPKDRMIVTYCTCPAEESSGQAVEILNHRGLTNAAALQGGLEAWQRNGYEIASGMPVR
jgi:rhodanese-related sulfurtransferase